MQVLDFIQYKFKAGNAHGLHSPFVYELYNQVIAPKKHYYIFDEIEKIRQQLLANNTAIEVTDLGAGSKKLKGNRRKISAIAKSSICSMREGAFLFELVSKYKYKNILELGTSFGVSTAYLSSPSKNTKIITLEGCPEIAKVAKNNFKLLNLKNIELITGNIDHKLAACLEKLKSVDIVYFDANHNYQSTINYFNKCLPYIHENSLFIFDDIYWSKEMKSAWKEISNHSKVGISIDLFDMGLVFFRQKQPKQFFTLDFKPNE